MHFKGATAFLVALVLLCIVLEVLGHHNEDLDNQQLVLFKSNKFEVEDLNDSTQDDGANINDNQIEGRGRRRRRKKRRKKRKENKHGKMFLHMFLGAALLKSLVFPLAYKIMAVMSGKALLMSSISFVLIFLYGIKSVVEVAVRRRDQIRKRNDLLPGNDSVLSWNYYNGKNIDHLPTKYAYYIK